MLVEGDVGGSILDMAERQATYARKGYLTASIDCRYHGKRAVGGLEPRAGYQAALVRCVPSGGTFRSP